MKNFYTCVLLLGIHFFATGQTITVSGSCITGSIILNKIPNENGKAAYEGVGTVMGFENTPVSISWEPSPGFWQLAFDGAPYFTNACNTLLPPKTNNGDPNCTWTLEEPSCTGANPLSIFGPGVLPVTLTSFTVSIVAEKALINWKTSSELNNKGFNIQRSRNGLSWTKIGFVRGAGQSATDKSYTYTDDSPLKGKSFYRLEQLDLDEKKTFSDIAAINLSGVDYTLGSNYSRSGVYLLTINSAESMEFAVSDFSGKKLVGGKASNGANKIDISKYPPGVYLLQISRYNTVVTEKLIKN